MSPQVWIAVIFSIKVDENFVLKASRMRRKIWTSARRIVFALTILSEQSLSSAVHDLLRQWADQLMGRKIKFSQNKVKGTFMLRGTRNNFIARWLEENSFWAQMFTAARNVFREKLKSFGPESDFVLLMKLHCLNFLRFGKDTIPVNLKLCSNLLSIFPDAL